MLKDWVTPGMGTVRPCQGQFYQHSSGSNVFYDDFGYCVPSYQGIKATGVVTSSSGTSWILIAALAVGGYLLWHYRKQVFG